MKHVHVFRTQQTSAGLLKEGKNYEVPDEVADRLIADGQAVSLDAPPVERAVRKPTEKRGGGGEK